MLFNPPRKRFWNIGNQYICMYVYMYKSQQRIISVSSFGDIHQYRCLTEWSRGASSTLFIGSTKIHTQFGPRHKLTVKKNPRFYVFNVWMGLLLGQALLEYTFINFKNQIQNAIMKVWHHWSSVMPNSLEMWSKQRLHWNVKREVGFFRVLLGDRAYYMWNG